MRAAEHNRRIRLERIRRELPLQVRAHGGRVKLLPLGERHELRQREAVDEMLLVHALDERLEFRARDRDWRRYDEHAAAAVERERLLRRGLHADDGQIVARAHRGHRDRRRCIAGDDDGIDALPHEERERLRHERLDLRARLCPVGHMRLIRIKEELLMRQHTARMMQHGEPAHARVKKRNLQAENSLQEIIPS